MRLPPARRPNGSRLAKRRASSNQGRRKAKASLRLLLACATVSARSRWKTQRIAHATAPRRRSSPSFTPRIPRRRRPTWLATGTSKCSLSWCRPPTSTQVWLISCKRLQPSRILTARSWLLTLNGAPLPTTTPAQAARKKSAAGTAPALNLACPATATDRTNPSAPLVGTA